MQLLSYREARLQICLPAYQWVLENCLQSEIARLRKLGGEQLVILLDYETNTEVENLRRPLSHASLIIQYLNGTYPSAA